jgi:hypothetical protein
LVRKRIPKAQISFKTDERIQETMNVALRLPLDDSYARKECGSTHRYNLEATVDDFLSTVKRQGPRPTRGELDLFRANQAAPLRTTSVVKGFFHRLLG